MNCIQGSELVYIVHEGVVQENIFTCTGRPHKRDGTKVYFFNGTPRIFGIFELALGLLMFA